MSLPASRPLYGEGADWLRGEGPLGALGVLGSWVFGPLAPALMGVMAGGCRR